MRAFEDVLWGAIQDLSQKLEVVVAEQRNNGVTTKAEFVRNIRKIQPAIYHTLLFNIFDYCKPTATTAATTATSDSSSNNNNSEGSEESEGGKTAQDVVIRTIRKMCNAPKDLETAKKMLGGIQFTERVATV